MDEKRNAIATGRLPLHIMLNVLHMSRIVDYSLWSILASARKSPLEIIPSKKRSKF